MLTLANSTSSPIPSNPATESPIHTLIHTGCDSLDDARSPFSIIEDEKEDSISVEMDSKYLLDDGRTGACVFIGNTFFGRGEWIGLVLDATHNGNTNGTINNKYYFQCDPQRGLFVRRQKIIHKIAIPYEYKQSEESIETDNTKIAVSFFNHEKGESASINAALIFAKELVSTKEESDDSVLSLEFEFNTPTNTATPHEFENNIHNNTYDDTPDTFRKLHELFSSKQSSDSDGDQRRVSMMETLSNNTQIISALRPVRKRMKMYTRSESWTPIHFKMKHNEDKTDDFLRPRLLYGTSSSGDKSIKINKKMGPIDIGRIEYTTPYGDYETEIRKSPFDIDKDKGWYPKPSPKHRSRHKSKDRNRNIKAKPRRNKLKRSTSTIDTNWKRSKVIKNNKHKRIHTHHLAWIEREYTLIPNPMFKGNIEKNIRMHKRKMDINEEIKKKKKQKAKSAKRRTKKHKFHMTSRSGSGPLIRLQPSNVVNDINIILEDSCTDVEEYGDTMEDNYSNARVDTVSMSRSRSYTADYHKSPKNDDLKSSTIKVKHYFL